MTEKKKIAFFEKYLSLWVALCIAGGILIGFVAGDAMKFMSTWEIYQVNIPIAILIWMMIYPMMLQIDFSSIKEVGKRPQGSVLTLLMNWLVKPVTIVFFALIFLTTIPAAFNDADITGQY